MPGPSVLMRDADTTTVYPSLVEGAPSIVVNTSESFVLIKEVDWLEMQSLARQYCDEHDAIMRQMFLAASRDSLPKSAISRVIGEGLEESIANLDAPYALRIETFRELGSGKVSPVSSVVVASCLQQAVADAGLDCAGLKYSPSYWDVLSKPYEIQCDVASRLLSPEAVRDMSWAHGRAKLGSIASARVEEVLATSCSTMEFLGRIADQVGEWLLDGHRSNCRGNKINREQVRERPLSLAWFSIWLAERSVWLFPTSVIARTTELIPIRWQAFRGGLVPETERSAWIELEQKLARMCHPGAFADGAGEAIKNGLFEAVRSTLAALRHVSTWRGADQLSMDFFSKIKAEDQGRSRNRQVIMAKLWDSSKRGLKLNPEQLQEEEAKLRPNKRRTRGQLGMAWPWVDDSSYQPLPTEKYFVSGVVAGPNLLRHLSELRNLLPKLSGKAVSNWTKPLNMWLMYLSSLPDTSVPEGLLSIDRTRHIDDPGDSQASTLCSYLRKLSLPQDNILLASVYTQLAAAWDAAYELAPTETRPSQRVCPVVPRFDAPKLKGANKGRTHRRPLDEEVLLFISAANRKNDFEFSRTRRNRSEGGRLLDNRLVRDPDSGDMKYEWFPGVAVLMDVLLNIPLRKKQARYLDSGEGDELILDVDTLETRSNPLPTAISGRNQSFFQRHSTSLFESKPVLGMWINTNKTGKPYSVPWLPIDIAQNCQKVIDWQVRYNAISAPVRDRDSKASERVVEDRFSEPVYPIFREPNDPTGEPIDEGVLQVYFEALLTHCECEFNSKTGRNVSFFREELQTKGAGKGAIKRKPIIDLHSLRVTGVTILIENGVPLEVVQLLVGHASAAMTIYYHVLDQRKVHEEMMRWMESRAPKLERLQSMSTEQLQEMAHRFLRNLSSDSRLGRAQFLDLATQRNPGWDYRYHGICAGGDCRYGGPPEKDGEDGTPLWRESACSLCRYRVTGAPWLVGLVHHVNQLWWELRQIGADIVELQLRKDSLEDEGGSVRSILGDMERAKIKRDHLFEEWIAEVHYVNQAKADLDDWIAFCEEQESCDRSDAAAVPVLRSPLGEEGIRIQLETVHELSQLTELVRGARVLESAILPRGILEDRNSILLQIARASGIDHEFLRLSTKDARRALDLFADMVLDATGPGHDEVQALVEGRMKLRDIPELEVQVLALIPSSGEVRGLIARRMEQLDGEAT